jgi:PKD domain-containing protein/peptidase M23-like protein
VPAGKFGVQAWHGPEYLVEKQELEIPAGTTRELTLALDRWTDMPKLGWFSGENHIHANYGYGAWHNDPRSIRDQCEGEDLHVANVVVANSDGDGVFDRQYFLGRPDPLSAARTIIYWNEEFRSTIWGHLTLGNLTQLVEPIFTGFKDTTNPWDIPTNADIADRARVQAGTVSYTHPASSPDAPYDGPYAAKGLPVDAALGRIDTLDVMGSGYDASKLLWYRLLNCGFRIPAAAGTDVFLNRITSYPPGWGRCYVKVTNGLDYAQWMRGQKAGRSFITSGPMLEWSADGREPGDTLRLHAPRSIRVRARASSQFPLKSFELVVNGVIASANATVNSDRDWALDQEIKIERAGWVAVRCASANLGFSVGSTLVAHGNPIYIEMPGRPLASRADAEYFLAWIDRLDADLKKRDRIPAGLEYVQGQLDSARAVYQRLAKPSAGDSAREYARPTRLHVVDLDLNETQNVKLPNGTEATVKLLRVEETRDRLRDAVRQARVEIALNGQLLVLTSATYNLPVAFGQLQIDCPITKGHVGNSSEGNAWGLAKDARLRLWPAGSPWIEPGTFVYPLKQRWFASHTQMANEPSFVDGGEDPSNKKIYYHYGLDFGGAEGMVDVIAASAGRVISSGTNVLSGYGDSPVKPRYDVVYLLDDRGWYYRYSHLQTIDAAIHPGAEVSMGQKVGVLGKEGGSGGWSHLHFDITSRQPSGSWGIQEGYAFLWETYQRQYSPRIIAVARPHHFVFTGDKVVLDGSKSWSASGRVARYDWTFTDGTTASGATVGRAYARAGEYSEILKVTDTEGEVDYDFATVLVIDKSAPDQLPPTIHPAFAPTMNIRAGDPITFKVRSFRTTHGNETWDFGDGSEKVAVKSDGNLHQHAKDGYAITEHRFAKPGHYLVRVERTNEHGQRAIAHLHVPVEAR